ncbi:MAG: tetratricopeptide repeat protein [Methanotrichaceae archaeon]|nr:tetratricopeptide repeat protein [Methanotrichaceae archaeon]
MRDSFIDYESQGWRRSGIRGAAAAFLCLLVLGGHAIAEEGGQATSEGKTSDDLIDLGLSLYQNRSYDEALDAYDQALLLSPGDARAWMGKGKVLNLLGEYNRSIEAYQNATRISSDDPEAWFWIGLNYYFMQDYNQSLEALASATDIDGNYTRAWEVKSSALVNIGRLNESLEASMEAIRTCDEGDLESLGRSWISRGFVLRQMGRDDDALEAFENASLIDPMSYDSWMLLGEALQARGEHDRAIEAYDSLISNIAPTSTPFLAYVLINKAGALMNIGRYEEASALYQEAIDLNYTDDPMDRYHLAQALLGKAKLLAKLGEYDLSIEACNRSMEADPRLADDAWRGIGDAYMGMGSYEAALEAYEKAIELYPEGVYAESGHAWKGKGDSLKALGRDDEALVAYRNSLAALDLAIEHPDEGRQAYPLNGEFWHNRGAVLEKLGLEAQSKEAYRRAGELGYIG